MDEPNISMKEYIMLEEEKAYRRGKVYNWETAMYGKIWYDKDVHDLRSVETEFPAIVFKGALTSEVTLSCEPMVSPLNENEIDFRISFDESDDEDYTVFSTGGNTRDLGSFGEETDEITDLHQDSPRSIVLRTWRRRRRHNATSSNTIELPAGNNVVPLRSDTIRLVQNRCSFYGLRSEDPNQHLKDFLKLMDSLDLDGNTVKLYNNILMFQQHHGESLSEAWTRFKDLLQKVHHHGIDLWHQVQFFYDHVNPIIRQTINHSTSEGFTAQMNFTSTDCHTKEELQSKGIKSPSKLLSPKYLFQSSIIKQNKNPLSPKRVHFVNSIIILNIENEAKEEGSVEPSKTNYTNRKNTNETDEEVKSEKKVEEETKRETEEEEEDNPEHFDTFPTMKELRLETRRKPLNPKKNCNFIGRVKGLKVFVRNFTYKCNFMVLEDITSVIDHYLGSMVFEKPFVEATRLVYNKEEGIVVFKRDKEKIMFKIPHNMDMF
nr:zinc finger, CCHC-type [Tanacetum cinerariifolium]